MNSESFEPLFCYGFDFEQCRSLRLSLREWEVLASLLFSKWEWEDEGWYEGDDLETEHFNKEHHRYLADWYYSFIKGNYDGGEFCYSSFPYNEWHNSLMYLIHTGVVKADIDEYGRYEFTIQLTEEPADNHLLNVEDYELEDKLGVS